MDDKTKKILTKISKKIFLVFLIGFTAIYISDATGYYEFEQHNKKVMTEEKIKQFEKDVKNGKNIDLNDYVIEGSNTYESNISKFGEILSKEIEKNVVSGLNNMFKILNGIMG